MATVQPFSYLSTEPPASRPGFRKPDETYGVHLAGARPEDSLDVRGNVPADSSSTTQSTQQLKFPYYGSQLDVENRLENRNGAENSQQKPEVGPELPFSYLAGDHPPRKLGFQKPDGYRGSEPQLVRQDESINTDERTHFPICSPPVESDQQPEVPRENTPQEPAIKMEVRENRIPKSVQPFSYLTFEPPPRKPGFHKPDDELSGSELQLARSKDSNPAEEISHFPSHQPPGISRETENRTAIIDDRTQDLEMWPPSSGGSSIFDNFILVGPAKGETPPVDAAPKTSGKPLKLMELFEPPPDQRRVAIQGVTYTESTDYHSSPVHQPETENRTAGSTQNVRPPDMMSATPKGATTSAPGSDGGFQSDLEPWLNKDSSLGQHDSRNTEWSPPNGRQQRIKPSRNNFSRAIIDDQKQDLEMWPPSSGGCSSIFDNFILVGPAKGETPPVDVAPKTSGKPLKLLELFEPPPDLRRVAIQGVTNTESSDFHNSPVDYSRPNKGQEMYERTSSTGSQPVSTFDNPDYSVEISTNHRVMGSMPMTEQEIPWSKRNVSKAASGRAAKNKTDKLHESDSRGQCACDGRLCVAILITLLLTSVVCLGLGFIAGWFGRGRALGIENP